MDHTSFDRFTRMLGAGGTRRATLGTLLAAGVAAALGEPAAGKNHSSKRDKKRKPTKSKGSAKDKKPGKGSGNGRDTAKAVAAQAADCSSPGHGTNINGCDYTGENFVNDDLSSSSMIGTIFNNANLCGADLSSSQLRNAQFNGANLTNADLSSSGCRGTQFNNATVFCQTKMCNGNIRSDDCPNANPNSVCCTDADCTNPNPACGANNICGPCTNNAQCPNGVCTCGANAQAGVCQEDFFQGFEQNTNGWEGSITRVPSGTNGITARTGGFFAKAAQGGTVFSRWGGYSSVFPTGGYDTELAIYLDPANAPADAQFDYSSAINQPNCNHRRDFIFAVGKSSGNPNFCVTASNNSPGFPCNPARDPETLTQAGWYLFKHEFRNSGGVLAVDMKLFAPNGNLLNTWTLSDPSDVIGTTVGGNRYGWIVTNDFSFIALDDSRRDS